MKGEAIRFLRSNTDARTYYSTLHTFREHLLLRNYPRDFVDRILDSITHDLREAYIPSLSPSPSHTPLPNIPRLVTTYSPHYKHWSLVQNDPSLSTLLPNPPQICYRRNPTLADSLVKSSLPGSHHPEQVRYPLFP